MTPDLIAIAAPIGAVVAIERHGPELAVSVDAPFLVQHSSGGKTTTKDAEAPLADFQLLGKSTERSGSRSRAASSTLGNR
jgi:hypothetical protein